MNSSGFAVAVAFRYVARELLLVFGAVFALLLAVGLGGRFIGFLQEAAGGRFAASALWQLLALRVPEFVQVTVPFAFLLALLLVFGRLHAEREYVALTSGGASTARIVAWLMAIALPLAAVQAALAFAATPMARQRYAALSLEQLAQAEVDAVLPGAFHVYGDGRRVTYAQSVDRETSQLRGVFMAEQTRGLGSIAVWAQSARQRRVPETGERVLELENGTRYEGTPGEPVYSVVRFRRLGQRLESEPVAALADVRAEPMAALSWREPRQAAELHGRIAAPLMTVVSALLAFAVARPRPRSGRFAKLVPGVGLFVGYYLALEFARDALAEGAIPALAGLWGVHAIALALAAILLRYSVRPRA